MLSFIIHSLLFPSTQPTYVSFHCPSLPLSLSSLTAPLPSPMPLPLPTVVSQYSSSGTQSRSEPHSVELPYTPPPTHTRYGNLWTAQSHNADFTSVSNMVVCACTHTLTMPNYTALMVTMGTLLVYFLVLFLVLFIAHVWCVCMSCVHSVSL